MKLLGRSALLAIAGGAIVFSACSHETDYYNPNQNKTEYENNWKSMVGNVSPEQDWNLATRVKASVDLTGLEGASSVSVYTALPGGSLSRVVAQYPATTRTFEFDLPEDATRAYVMVTDNSDRVLMGNYFAVSDGQMNVSAQVRGTRGDDCATAIGERIVPTDDFGFWDGNSLWDSSIYPYFQGEWDHSVKYANVFALHSLSGVATATGSSVTISDIADIVGHGGVFAEQGIDAEGRCNLMRWEEELKPSEGVEYVMETDGPLELTFMYGGTIKKNKFGYLYYRDGASVAEILSAPHYILMEDASPQANVKVDGETFSDGMQLPGLVNSYEDYGTADVTLTGTTYRLVYFDEQGNGSFTFPAGTHVVFFEIIDANSKTNPDGTPYYDAYFAEMRYSLPWMNRYYYRPHNESHPNWESLDAARNFVTYKWNGQTVLGMEDEGGDHDMNDVLFFVNGKFDRAEIAEIGKAPQPQAWILACEDLGSTNDFDFNDVVFEVAHAAGSTKAVITPLAAGGTLPATICIGSTEIGEIHGLLGVETNYMTTTGSYSSVTVTELTVPEDFTVTDDMGGFYVRVQQDGTSMISINSPGLGMVPQMICVPCTWRWPHERVSIVAAYPEFGEWGANYNNNTWYLNPVDSKVINR